MKINKEQLSRQIEILSKIQKNAKDTEKKYTGQLKKIHPEFKRSAANLIHYLALRHHNIKDLQNTLGQLGISRLGRAESHVLQSVAEVKHLLQLLQKPKKVKRDKADLSIKQGMKFLKSNTNRLLGKKMKGSAVRIMVTMPTEAATDRKMIHQFVTSGMNSARVNCAHDNPEIWELLIQKLKKVRKKTGRNCKICMDLGGPKLRTGAIKPGPNVEHIQPERDVLGHILKPATVCLTTIDDKLAEDEIKLPVSEEWLGLTDLGDEILFKDARNKSRKMKIATVNGKRRYARCYDSAYITSGTRLTVTIQDNKKRNTVVGEVPAVEQRIELCPGDLLILNREPIPGEPARFDEDGNLIQAAHISCTLPEIFNDVKEGEPILLDDGKFEGVIRCLEKEKIEVEITYAKGQKASLKADKGINLPESNLSVKGLTEKDKNDLKFITQHADVVNMSFVNSAQDVEDMISELDKLNAPDLGIIFKIETISGFRNLPSILLTAMRRPAIGIMIARGDLAIEVGWKHLARIQEEILWLCEAAHIPIVWATQVLESQAKKGRPSRAEITDAASAQRAECVMLNKGPHIAETIRMLDDIMSSMEAYHLKKAPLIPTLKTTDYLNLD